MDLGRDDSSERLEHGSVLNRLLADHHIDMLPSSGHITETEQALAPDDVSGDLLEIFESQLQQTVHLVDLMPADQKSRALASMCGLLSQKLPETSATVTNQNQESADYADKKNPTMLPLSGDEILSMPPASLLQSDSEDNSQAATLCRTGKVYPESHVPNSQTDQVAESLSHNISPLIVRRNKTVNHQNGIKREIKEDSEEKGNLHSQSLKSLLEDSDSKITAAKFEDVDASHDRCCLPPKKRNRGRPCKALSNNDNIAVALSLGNVILEASKGMSIGAKSTSGNSISTRISREPVDQQCLRRSKRDRKISVRVAEFLGAKTPLLKSAKEKESLSSVNSNTPTNEGSDATNVPVKRGRGRPRKNNFISPVNVGIKSENKDCPKPNEVHDQLSNDKDNFRVVTNGVNILGEGTSKAGFMRDLKPALDVSKSTTVGDGSIDEPKSGNNGIILADVSASRGTKSAMDTLKDSQRHQGCDSIWISKRENKYSSDDENQNDSQFVVLENHKYCCMLCGKVTECEASLQAHLVVHSDHNQICSKSVITDKSNEVEPDSDQIDGSDSQVDDENSSCGDRSVTIKMESNSEHSENTGMILLKNINQYIVKENNKYHCTICGKIANYKANLKVHLRVHSGERPFTCEICDKAFAASNNLQRHINETHEKRRPFICETCGQGCFTMKSLAKHQIKKHGPEEEKKKQTFTCETCGKCFKWRSDLKDHCVKHTNTTPFKCETCGRAFTFLNNLRRHRKIHKDYRPHRCHQCGKRFIEPRCLRLHINRIHLGMDVKPQGDPKYSCNICGKPFFMKSWLELHMLSHTGYKPHPCDVCEKKFSLKANLKRHMLTHTGENPFPCTECTKKFKSRRALKLHLMIHRNEKPFVCDVCKKGFTNKSALKEHMVIHDSQPRFFCNTCNQTFLRVSHLQLHMERHEGKPRHTCDKCNGKFYRKCDLNRHLLKHSSIKPYGCSWCNKRFTRKQYLNNHIRINHTMLSRRDQTRKILLQLMPPQDLSRPIFRIVSKQSGLRCAGINESVDVSSLLKLTECSNSLVTVNEASLSQAAQDVSLSHAHTVSHEPGPTSVMAESTAFDTVISNSITTSENLSAMTKTVINSHPDPLQQATSMLFESEEECQDAGIMTSNTSIQYVTVQEEFNSIPSGLTTLVNIAAKEQQQKGTLLKPGEVDHKQVVLTLGGSDHVVMVASAEDGSFISQDDLDHLDIMNLKADTVTNEIHQSASGESFRHSAAGIEILSQSDGMETNILSSSGVKMASDASFAEIESSHTQQHSSGTEAITIRDNRTVTRDILDVQEGEQIFMETPGNTFSSPLESDGLVLGPYTQVADETVVQGEARYHEVIMLNDESMQLLIQSPDVVHNIEVQQGSDVQVIESVLRRSDETSQDSSVGGPSEMLKGSDVPQPEIIYQPDIIQRADTDEHITDSITTDDRSEGSAHLGDITEGQYLVILKD